MNEINIGDVVTTIRDGGLNPMSVEHIDGDDAASSSSSPCAGRAEP